jgi:hypothetical protein
MGWGGVSFSAAVGCERQGRLAFPSACWPHARPPTAHLMGILRGLALPRTSSSSTDAQGPGASGTNDTSTSVVPSGGQRARSGATVSRGLGAA